VLVIARLDRLARNVAFIANLMNSDVEFVAVDMPHANRPTIHILAAVAEHERELISQRMAVESAQLADGKLLLSYMKDAHSVGCLVSLDGKAAEEIAMPGLGRAEWSGARLRDN
jgi:hypothetical protein